MPKLTLIDLATNATVGSQTAAVNNNNTSIETAIENTLSRDGTSPNEMLSNLDMNNFKILNLPQPVDDTDVVRLEDLGALQDTIAALLGGVDWRDPIFATLAGTSASLAAQSALDAAAQVLLAAAQVSLATTQANNAATSASDASTSATNASNSASAASTSASNAASSASAAAASASTAASSAAAVTTSDIYVVFDGRGSVLGTGVQGYIEIPFSCTINRVTLLADTSGSCVVDIWKDTYANYPPTVADTITAAAKPTISAALKAQDSTLTGWNKTINAGDILGFNLDSVSSITKLTVSLKITRT